MKIWKEFILTITPRVLGFHRVIFGLIFVFLRKLWAKFLGVFGNKLMRR